MYPTRQFHPTVRPSRSWLIVVGLVVGLSVPAVTASAQSAPAAQAAQHEGAEQGASAAEGAEGEHAVSLRDIVRLNNYQLWGPVINFLCLLFVLVWFGGAPLKKFLVDRRQKIAKELEEAQRLKAEAQAKYDEYAGRLEKLDQEMERLRAEMIKAGEADRDRIVAEAEAKAARMRRETAFVIEQQMKQLREDLTHEAIRSAVGAAEKVLQESVTNDDQQRLAKGYLTTLGGEVAESVRPPPVSHGKAKQGVA